jgi:hypothetical protein
MNKKEWSEYCKSYMEFYLRTTALLANTYYLKMWTMLAKKSLLWRDAC